MEQTTISIVTLGCKVNYQESEKLADDFRGLGYAVVGPNEAADVCIINSCTVTSASDAKTRQRIRQARSKNPSALVCVAGCLPEVSREAVSAMEEVDLIIGSMEKEHTAAIVTQRLSTLSLRTPTRNPQVSALTPVQSGRTRAFLKAEDGCDQYCAYCIIPAARGPVRSKPPEEITKEAAALLARGYREIVLTGINLARYGADFPKKDIYPTSSSTASALPLYALLENLTSLNEVSEYRIRLGSLEPTVLTAQGAGAIAALPRICPGFHLSLQSGSDRILRAMGRNYDTKSYLDIVHGLRGVDPHFAVTTDVIVGFPGETDDDFAKSLAFVESVGFAKVHVFPYSARTGTRAAAMDGQVPEAVKKARAAVMRSAGEKSAKIFLDGCAYQSRSTLTFGADKHGMIRGLTDNGIDVRIPASAVNTYTEAQVKENDFIDLLLTPKITCGFE